jgi:hypothetical protein
VIAPPGNPVISLDSRLLDRIELIARSSATAFVMSGAALGGGVAAAMSVIPGGMFLSAGLAYLAHERLSEGLARARARDLLLALGDLEVALHVADGPAAAKQVAEKLAPYTRGAPITRPEVYEDARRRMLARSEGRPLSARRELERGLVVGDDVVTVAGGLLTVGAVSFRIEEVRDYAVRGANLPLPGGRMLQAAMGLLVVAAEERAAGDEDLDGLAARIKAYEEWTGRSAGR